jgi:flagellar biosynthesis protein FliR
MEPTGLPIDEFLVSGVFAFILVFVRFGTAFMVLPGFGDSYVSMRIRLLTVLAFTFALFPVLMPFMPESIPSTTGLFFLVMSEFVIGLFFGTIARIFMTALDTAGMVISIQSGLGSAMLFNPQLSSQGSLIGAFLMLTGVLLLFVTNLHHMLILGIFESYQIFPVGNVPDTGSMADLMARAVSSAFRIGVKLAAPFIIIGVMIYAGMGVLSRLMPQIQVFMLALPLQILLALTTLSMVLMALFGYWIAQFESNMMAFFSTN